MALSILQRTTWKARDARGNMDDREAKEIRELFVHWPGRPSGSYANSINSFLDERAAMRQIQLQHFGQGWSDIGYNHVLIPDYIGDGHTPRIYTGRGWRYTPASQLEHNTGTISIMVLMGPSDPLTSEVTARLRSYVRWCDQLTGHKLSVRGHGEVVSTACPGPALRSWVKNSRHR